MNKRRQQELIAELHAMSRRFGQLMMVEIFDEDYANGQTNSCFIVADQQVTTVMQMILDIGAEGVMDPRNAKNPVLPKLERRAQSGGKRGVAAAAKKKAGVVRPCKGLGARVVAGGAR